MSGDRRKEIVRHLSEENLDRLLSEADDPKVVRRLTFVKNLYKGDSLEEAADRVGKSESTGSRWARRWNKGGLGQLTPNFGDGRPPKLGEEQQEQLLEMLRDGQPWQPQEIQHLINEEFGVEYHPVYLSEFLKDLGLSYAIPRTKRPSRPDDAEDILDERVGDALAEDTEEPHNKREDDDEEGWVVDDDVCTDGGTVVGFFHASHPQPYDNSRRMWYVDDPHHERPLVQIFEPAVGFYALNGESVVSFPEDQTKERICECLERIREQNPATRILLVLDNTDQIESLAGDKGYDDQSLRDALRAEGVRPVIRHRLFAHYDHAHNARLDSDLYGQRWMAETAFSAIKRRFGSAVRPSAWYREFRELVLTVAVYNLEQAIKE